MDRYRRNGSDVMATQWHPDLDDAKIEFEAGNYYLWIGPKRHLIRVGDWIVTTAHDTILLMPDAVFRLMYHRIEAETGAECESSPDGCHCHHPAQTDLTVDPPVLTRDGGD